MRWGFATIVVLPLAAASGGQLQPETLNAWNSYIQTVDANMQARAESQQPFLWIDQPPTQAARVRAGEVVVAPAADHMPRRVPFGLIHDWIGAAFIPDAKIADVTAALRDYDRYKEYFHPHVIESRLIRSSPSQDEFSLVLVNKALVVSMAIDSDYASRYCRVDSHRSYSVSRTTRVQEIRNPGQPSESELPAGEGSGYIWRLYSVTRFEQRDGGVYVEVEALALSRDIPAALRLLVDPIVRSASRSAVATSLKQMRDAVSAGFLSVSVPTK